MKKPEGRVKGGANWLGSITAWNKLAPGGTLPVVRNAHTAVYDNVNNRMVVFGGWTGSERRNDAMVLADADGNGSPVWSTLGPSGTPPSTRYEHSAVYDPTTNRMVVFGGIDPARKNDTWGLTSANGLGPPPAWSPLTPTGSAPSARFAHSAVFDPVNNRMIVFGGNDGARKNDTWVLSNATGVGGTPQWIPLTPPGPLPAAREQHSAVYDEAENRMVVFGGFTNSGATNVVWMLSNANGLGGTPTWTQMFPAGPPPSARYGHSAVYDFSTGRMIVFSGVGGPEPADVWVLTEAAGVPEIYGPLLIGTITLVIALSGSVAGTSTRARRGRRPG